MPVRGSLTGIAGRSAHGWVVPVDMNGDPVRVTLVANGQEIGGGVADRPGPEGSARGFSIPFERGFLREGHVRFDACVDGEAFASFDQDFGAGLSDLFAGQVEAMADGALRGWAVNLGPSDIPVTINVFLGSIWLGATMADQARNDIRRRFGVQSPAGFSFPIPAPFRHKRVQVFRLFYANTTIELEGSPMVFPAGRASPSAGALAALLG